MPALLKPAPTRLRLVLWALAAGLDDFPESPPPGLVTVPVAPDAPQGYYTMAGYRPAGSRAIRIDMLERLADMLRGQDAREGFEATADMLSITGLTLEQFADLMQGLGYAAERGERPKRAPARAAEAPPAPAAELPEGTPPEPDPVAEDAAVATPPALSDEPQEERAADPVAAVEAELPASDPAPVDEMLAAPADPATDEAAADADPVAAAAREQAAAPAEEQPAPAAATAAAEEQPAAPAEAAAAAAAEPGPAPDAPAETEVFFTFTWAPRRRGAGEGARSRPGARDGKRGGPPKGKGKGKQARAKGSAPAQDAARSGQKPKRERDKPVDPDSPFAALAALKGKG